MLHREPLISLGERIEHVRRRVGRVVLVHKPLETPERRSHTLDEGEGVDDVGAGVAGDSDDAGVEVFCCLPADANHRVVPLLVRRVDGPDVVDVENHVPSEKIQKCCG